MVEGFGELWSSGCLTGSFFWSRSLGSNYGSNVWLPEKKWKDFKPDLTLWDGVDEVNEVNEVNEVDEVDEVD